MSHAGSVRSLVGAKDSEPDIHIVAHIAAGTEGTQRTALCSYIAISEGLDQAWNIARAYFPLTLFCRNTIALTVGGRPAGLFQRQSHHACFYEMIQQRSRFCILVCNLYQRLQG